MWPFKKRKIWFRLESLFQLKKKIGSDWNHHFWFVCFLLVSLHLAQTLNTNNLAACGREITSLLLLSLEISTIWIRTILPPQAELLRYAVYMCKPLRVPLTPTVSNYWMRLSTVSWIINAEVCVIFRSLRFWQIPQTQSFIDNLWYHAKSEFINCFINLF